MCILQDTEGGLGVLGKWKEQCDCGGSTGTDVWGASHTDCRPLDCVGQDP